ncbi:hypothetical protein OH76DRAFT_214738 [Lentinus brumalis]|uniref:Uncharacterized protein n=1 Tax=Lentinus brumalis TaxID=2498619 RepID=A0A371CMI6_9APHY|nr:hypothetical protein OH76DRAFT_214738 [Polyporus brumalis]
MASQADDMEDLNNARAVPALALAQHVNFPPELWAKIFQELEDHPDTMRSASLACRALRGVAQELLFRHVVIKEPSRIVRLIMPEVSRRVAALTTRLSLLVPSEDTEDYKQRVLDPVYALLAHAVPGAELQLRYLRIKSGLLAQLYDVFMDARRPRSPPAEEDEDVIGVGAQEAVDASEVELHGLQALQELSVVYEPTTCSSSSAHNAHALQHVCTAYGKCLTVVRLDGVAQGAERLLLTSRLHSTRRTAGLLHNIARKEPVYHRHSAPLAHRHPSARRHALPSTSIPGTRRKATTLDFPERPRGTSGLLCADVEACVHKS